MTLTGLLDVDKVRQVEWEVVAAARSSGIVRTLKTFARLTGQR